MKLEPGKKVYIVSDSHLGVPDHAASLQREKLLVKWLDEVSQDAQEIYLLGDIFDFWFEYRTVVPKGFVRLFGKLAGICDRGIPVHFFTGNHDMWAFGYFEKEIGLTMHRHPVERTYNGKAFMIGHGDGLGPGDTGFKMMRKVFSNRWCQKAFAWLHPGLGTRLALYLSRKSRMANGASDEVYLGDDKERLLIYCKQVLKERHFDYFIFGHRHLPLDIPLGQGSRYINTGDWVSEFSYVVFDGKELQLKTYLENC